MKTLKFKDYLVPLILSGEKNTTWRLFDDKDLKEGDELILINKDTLEEFARAKILFTKEKTLGEIVDSDFEGHEKFESEEEMYKEYQSYYGDKVGPRSVTKLVRFELLK